MSSRAKLTVIIALLFVFAVATAVAMTMFLTAVATAKLVWFAFGGVGITGVLLGTLLTNLAYTYGD